MVKAYINDAIIGNSRMLGCLTGEGVLQRLFWPNIDHYQHINQFEVGVKFGSKNVIYLTDPIFTKMQEYRKGTNILITTYTNQKYGLKIKQVDFCLADQDVLIRNYEVENLLDLKQEVKWMLYSSHVTSTSSLTGSLFDFDHEALIHYQRDQYMSISSDLDVESFQLGGDAKNSLTEGVLNSCDSVLMVPDGALIWNLGHIEAKGTKSMTMQICFSRTYKDLKARLNIIRKIDSNALYQDTQNYWLNYLKTCSPANARNNLYNDLYERTLLVFKLMYDESNGGLMAAPEMDEHMEMCGRYAYCWGRDAAFIADALDLCGLHNEVEKFYDFAAATQGEDGSWFQRYCMDGNLAPAWGLQVDETGALLYGMWMHYVRTNKIGFLQNIWENVRLAAEFLMDFMDPDTGLTKPSRDLWEERWGEHTYSAASVYAGLISSVKIAECLGESEVIISPWKIGAENLKKAIMNELWDVEQNCYLRGIRTQLYPESKMEGLVCMTVPVNSKGAMKKVVCKDKVVDVSLIGLSVPFGVLDTQDDQMKLTIHKIEEVLTAKNGGIKRYEDDEYIGGNPWILTTLWLSLYYAENKEFDKALKHFNWAVGGRTKLNLLPEQVGEKTGEPLWIVPLTWSHAMYALVYHTLLKEKLI